MYRRGPPKSTPSTVLCQKCLQRGHYSYECKVTPQDRPYKARPSRSQQLRNPKLAPKLHEDTFDAQELQKGVADVELAKREAMRRQRRGSSSGSESDASKSFKVRTREASKSKTKERNTGRRHRSPSYSVSGSTSDPASRSPSPPEAPKVQEVGSRSLGREGAPRRAARTYSRSPSRSRSVHSLSPSAGSRSPTSPARKPQRVHDKGREISRPHENRTRAADYFGKKDIRDVEGNFGRESRDRRRHQYEARSPVRESSDKRAYRQRDNDRWDGRSARRLSDTGDGQDRDQERKSQDRDRSLSPFSQRLALTKKLQSGR